MDCLSRFVACLRPSNPNCVVPQFCERFAVCFHDSVGFVREYYPSSRLEDLCAEFFPLHLHHDAIEPKDSAPLLSSSVYIEWHSECWVADLRFSALDGRWPGHEITKNLCAPFIHSFIVDEWETTNHKPRDRRDVPSSPLFLVKSPPSTGRCSGHEITKNLCALFIHSFIVDEWETTNHIPRVAHPKFYKTSTHPRMRVPHPSAVFAEGWWATANLNDRTAGTKAQGRSARRVITKNLCAPFIHGFIVDEWETTNHKPRKPRTDGTFPSRLFFLSRVHPTPQPLRTPTNSFPLHLLRPANKSPQVCRLFRPKSLTLKMKRGSPP